MEKIKQILSPGSSKDDEVLYGDAAERRASATTAPTTGENAAPLHPVEGSDKKEHSVLRQILNPGGDKYDDQRFGTTASTETSSAGHGTHSSSKEHTILGQITNPGGEKYDDQRFGAPGAASSTTAEPQLGTAPPAESNRQGVFKQIINPGGEKYEAQRFGSTSEESGQHTQPMEQKDHSILKQVLNPGGEKYDADRFGSTGVEPTTQTTGALGSDPTSISHPATATAIPGTTFSRLQKEEGSPTSTMSIKSGVEGPYAPANTERVVAQQSTMTEQTLPDRTLASTTGSQSHAGRDAALAGAVVIGGVATHEADNYRGIGGHETEGESIMSRPHPLNGGAIGDATGVPTSSTYGGPGHANERGIHQPSGGVVHHLHGPHPTDTGNQLDPLVAGGFSGSTGQDRHAHGGEGLATEPGTSAFASGLTGTGAGATQQHATTTESAVLPGGSVDTSSSRGLTSANDALGTSSATPEHHFGRDAAIAGGVGAAGVAGYESTRGHGETGPVADSQVTSGTTNPDSLSSRYAENTGGVAHSSAHGVRSHGDETGPASKTVGPHESNIANIVDPRVQPDMATLKGEHATATGTERDHHTGRDAAVGAGAVGAGSAAGYAAQHDTEGTHEKHHNKLQKKHPDEKHQEDHGEKKPSLLHRILHPGEKKHDSDEHTTSHSDRDTTDSAVRGPSTTGAVAPGAVGASATGTALAGEHGSSSHRETDREGRVIEPHTGPPMDIGKYGPGTGGTDRARNIEGYHETNPALQHATVGTGESTGTGAAHHAGGEGVAGPDWEAIRKSNTPY